LENGTSEPDDFLHAYEVVIKMDSIFVKVRREGGGGGGRGGVVVVIIVVIAANSS